MIKRILVPLDISPFAAASVARACELAKTADAEVTGMVVLDTAGIEKSANLPFRADLRDYPGDGVVESEVEAAEKLKVVVEAFENTVGESGVRSRLSKCEGHPYQQILAASCFHDLVIMGSQSFYHFETEEGPGDTLDKVLKNAVVPVMVVPAREPDALKSALVLFDGSPLSSRALHAFAEFWQYDRPKVRLLAGDVNQSFGESLLKEAKHFLKAHGVDNIEVVVDSGSVIRSVEDVHLDWSDFIVLGIHSRATVKDLIVGSVARHLIERGHKTLLFSP